LSERERELYRELGNTAADPRRHFGAGS